MDTLQVDQPAAGIAHVLLNRPDRLNALNRTMFDELISVAERLRTDNEVRAVVVSGAGAGFCAGYDLDAAAEFANSDMAELAALQDAAVRAIYELCMLPKPVIAAVHGPATGGGFSISLAADMRIAGESARFQGVFVRIGLSGADMGASWLLPRIVGTGLAAELLCAGRPMFAEEAARTGLANRTVPDAELLTEAFALASTIAEHQPLAVQTTKRILRANMDAPSLWASLEMENRAQVALMREPATAEAVRALRESQLARRAKRD
ncbi:MAG TPA: enoyl-CoA hydratase-related protein [Pseudonocardia sp.]|jgi:enoyl-CoA hydratase/carnithine racemase|nr:enoyl-CoA hydratase-related protein [Pseudonocardia sp.]